MNKRILQFEGAGILLISIFLYSMTSLGWSVFLLLLFAPDLSMLGYVLNNKAGATIYNIFHTLCFPLLVTGFALFIGNDTTLALSYIWLAHIGLDRMLGYGLKYPTHFKDTHLNRV